MIFRIVSIVRKGLRPESVLCGSLRAGEALFADSAARFEVGEEKAVAVGIRLPSDEAWCKQWFVQTVRPHRNPTL